MGSGVISETETDTPTEAEEALKRYFGFNSFRQGQDEVVSAVLQRRDVLVIMPTGGGKSLCYQLPALMMAGTTLVVSPLISLMKDQVDSLLAREIAVTFINSTLSAGEYRERMEGLLRGVYKLVYVAPERFRDRRFMEALRSVEVSLVAIDEAHCVSQWGHDFRPDYLRLGEGVEALGRPPVMALTATATPEVRDDIVKQVKLREPALFVTGFGRANLEFRVVQASRKVEKLRRLKALIDELGTGIVYCATRRRVDELAEELESLGVNHVTYHGGMDEKARSEKQDAFMKGKVEVAVATNAFGMGIDRSDIRFVAHYEIPGSIEAYYQEAGRAGRDGLPAVCELYFSHADRQIQEFFIEGNNPGRATIERVYATLKRLCGQAGEVIIPLQELAEESEVSNGMAVSTSVSWLSRSRIIERFDIPGRRTRGTRLLNPGLMIKDLPLNDAELREKADRDYRKLEGVINYGQSLGCRQGWILEYFGEKGAAPCGQCDECFRSDPGFAEFPDEERLVTVRKALSGVARLCRRVGRDEWEGCFGRGRIIDVLKGKKTARLMAQGHDRLSTYGLLKDEDEGFLKELFREFERRGLIEVSGGMRPLVSLSRLGHGVMTGKARVRLHWPKGSVSAGGADSKEAGQKGGRGHPGLIDGKESLDLDDELYEVLKEKRSRMAKARGGKPAFTVCSNAVLEELARRQPLTLEETKGIKGIGPVMRKNVIPTFLKLIAEYRQGKLL